MLMFSPNFPLMRGFTHGYTLQPYTQEFDTEQLEVTMLVVAVAAPLGHFKLFRYHGALDESAKSEHIAGR